LPTRQAIALAMQIQAHETFREVFDVKAKPMGMIWEQFTQGYIAKTSHTQRVMMLEEPANMAVFMASDKASVMTGTAVNLTRR
jgi:hypothetical protein